MKSSCPARSSSRVTMRRPAGSAGRSPGCPHSPAPRRSSVGGCSCSRGGPRAAAGFPPFHWRNAGSGGGVARVGGWTPGKGDGPMPSWANMVEKYDKNGDGAITPDEVKGTDFESFFRAQDLNRDGRITKEDNDRMRELMAKGENVAVAVKPGAQGELTESHLAWKQTRGLPYVPSPLYYQGRVYLLKDRSE